MQSSINPRGGDVGGILCFIGLQPDNHLHNHCYMGKNKKMDFIHLST